MEKIIVYSPQVKTYFKDLIIVLFEKEYFGFKENAEEYVLKIRHFIEENIEIYPSKITPSELQQYGENYISYKVNSQTSWYIFFSQAGSTYFVKHITNNHVRFFESFNL